MKKLISMLVVAAAVIGVGNQASALTGWYTVAYTRDSSSFPDVTLGGGITNPEWVQVLLSDGTYAGTTSVSVSLDCRDNNYNNFDRSIGQSLYLPRTIAWDIPTWVTYCRVYVSAYYFNPGYLAAAVQARY